MKKPAPHHRSSTPDNLAFGNRIREARERLNMSQYDLAKELDLTPGAIGQWELGLAGPSRSVLAQLPGVLGVSFEWLIWGKVAKGEDLKAHTKPEVEVLQTMKNLSTDEQNMLASMVNGMASSLGKSKRH